MINRVIFESDGSVRFIYDDATATLFSEIGKLTIKRASHVEPCDEGGWTADMSPVGGPVLGPFDTRETALFEERVWLTTHNIPAPR